MVSPSKIQHQEHEQPSRENKTDKRSSHVRVQKGLKPLEKKTFYLDIKNHATAAKIEAKIKDLGGAIELFLVRSVSLVVSDRVDKAGYVSCKEKRKWGCVSGGSGGIPSLRSIDAPTPTPTPPTPFFSSECPLSNTTNLRGQTTQRSKSRVDAMLERALIQPQQCSVDPLDNAQNWGIPIWAIDKLQAWLDKIYASFKDANRLKSPKDSGQHSSRKDLKVRHLKGPYIKFESFHRSTRPVFIELPAWPSLNFHGEAGSCPFNTKKRGRLEDKVQKKEVKENRVDVESVKKRWEQSKEMTRRPRTTGTRARRTEQLSSGYCEICRIGYRDLAKHVQTDQHLNFVRNDDNFLSLDTLINAGANVEAFLKLNRTKDIEKDCNLFPNGDRNLHEVVLPEEKVNNKSAKSLDEYGVDEIKMVQCNGARRNLNLKLNSSHNLRARAKHESGHLLRSKGSPWHEVDKTEKFYDKFEGFTIKKRSKGTIWIEEEDPEDDFIEGSELKESKQQQQEEYKIKTFSKDVIDDRNDEKSDRISCNNRRNENVDNNLQKDVVRSEEQNGLPNFDYIKRNDNSIDCKQNETQLNGDDAKSDCAKDPVTLSENVQASKVVKEEPVEEPQDKEEIQSDNVSSSTKKISEECERPNVVDVVCNGHTAKTEEVPAVATVRKTAESTEKEERKDKNEKNEKNEAKNEEKSKCGRSSRRGGRSVRGRHRLSVEERLIEDNRAYYKVEVLGSKLRSSVLPGNNAQCSVPKDVEDDAEKKEVPSSEKPVVVRFKRVRKSELSLLSDEAESFMFGEPRRDDSSETSDGEQSSVLPRDTESECNDPANSICPSSPLNSSSPVKCCETNEEDSQDSLNLGRARKRRRTQAEALIKDNADYYKFETPGSRLRYQAPLTGIKDSPRCERTTRSPIKIEEEQQQDVVEKIYPSKPSPEVEKMQFSFEAVPKSEPWYQTYQRQDEGAEFWHYFSEGDSRKPFLLPYEIENFHETLIKNHSKTEVKRKGRGRSTGCIGRSPRKSPRCHASTLAIMSTIIRKKEQQQQQQQHQSSISASVEDCQSLRSQTNTPRPDQKLDGTKSDVDEELKEIAKTIDEMLGTKDPLDLDDSFEPDNVEAGINFFEPNVPKGAPPNLLELLDNCHELANCLENSSCASSECGEGNIESPLKRRKKRKNRTGWPGIKMKKKLQSKPLVDVDSERENVSEKRVRQNGESFDVQIADTPGRILEETTGTMMTANVAGLRDTEDQLCFGQQKNESCLQENGTYNSAKTCHESSIKRETCPTEIGMDSTAIRATIEDCGNPKIPENRPENERSFSLKKDYAFGKELSEIDEISENEPGNDENHENLFCKDVNSISERRFIGKTGMKKRQRENTSSDACEPHKNLENQEILCQKDPEARIDPRKHHNSNVLPRKRQQKTHSENPDSEIERHSQVYRRSRVTSRKRMYPRKRQRRNNNIVSPNGTFEDENCKKDSYLSITCRKQQQQQHQQSPPPQQQQSSPQTMKGVKRRNDAVSSETQDSELECALSERVSPTLVTSSELEQRRSSIDFQPVVRMMKIEDQVDMDHSILSVTVASNRRLRSSSSPRSNLQPPKKRLKTSSRGQFGRWLKSS